MTDLRLKPIYVPLVQKPNCCNVTCLLMILYRRGHKLFDQESLAATFKVKIPPTYQKFFNVKLPHCKSKKEEGGLRTIDSSKAVNRFFQKHSIPLHASSVKASEIPDLHEFIEAHLQADHDLWIEYKSHEIHKEALIHDSVIEGLRRTKSGIFVTLVDPFSDHRTRLKVPLDKIQRSISRQFGRETGFLVIAGQ